MKSTSQGTVSSSHQVGDEQHGPLQHPDHHEIPPLVVARDLGAKLGHPPLEVVPGNKGLTNRRVPHTAQSRLAGVTEPVRPSRVP